MIFDVLWQKMARKDYIKMVDNILESIQSILVAKKSFTSDKIDLYIVEIDILSLIIFL